ncbi:response regulator [Camelimonas abortus]|uniref:Response regulator n=1 Tax=Camelimonas abortus TaxID=1017184 RepID=A0ABV7LCN4_9HYPH
MTCAARPPVVLLVEDEMFVRMTTCDMLEDAGFTVLEAGDCAAALALLRQAGRVDLLVSDVGLPDMDGVTLYAACRELCPDLPAIFITGYGQDQMVQEMREAPHARVLGKPFQQRDLSAAISELLPAAV